MLRRASRDAGLAPASKHTGRIPRPNPAAGYPAEMTATGIDALPPLSTGLDS
jgi:hypothetical protein